jgi:molybdopterin converting factor small subunit
LTVTVEVDLVGVLGKLADKEAAVLQFGEVVTVQDVVQRLLDASSSAFKQALVDPEHNDPRPNVVILVNKREISVLDGLKTKVSDGDKLVLIPVSHGG